MKRLAALFIALMMTTACSPEEWIALYFDDVGQTQNAINVATCESGLNPEAMSPGGGNHGLFQINSVHRASFERVTRMDWSYRYHPGHNAQFAKWLWEQSGWGPWSCRP